MKPLFTIVFYFMTFSTQGQIGKFVYMNFDTLDYQLPTQMILIDSVDTTNAWQIGKPQKNIFASALTGLNAAVTDTVKPCLPNDTSALVIQWDSEVTINDTGYTLYNIRYWQSLDIDTGDTAIAEIRYPGNNWQLVKIDKASSNGWQSVYVPGPAFFANTQMRFTLFTGGSTKTRDGWMIDSISVQYIQWSSVDVVDAISNVEIFPSPANNEITVLTPSNDNFVLSLLNVDGKKMLERAVKGNERIDISALPAGFYFYQVYDGNDKPVKTGKLNVVR